MNELRKGLVEILYGELTYRNLLSLPKLRTEADLKINQITELFRSQVEQMENPYKHNRSLLDGYEQFRKDILGKLSEELK